MRSRLNFKAATTQSVNVVLKVVTKSVFIKMSLSKKFKSYGLLIL